MINTSHRTCGIIMHTVRAYTIPFRHSIYHAYTNTHINTPHTFPTQVDLGVYSHEKVGVAIPRGWDNAPKHSTRSDLLRQRREDALPPERSRLGESLFGVRCLAPWYLSAVSCALFGML